MSRRLIVSGGSRPLELVLVGTLIVGRDPACDISEINDPLMSRRHAAFSAGPREVFVRDLGSRNGILVNGVKTAEAALHSGDVVQIGHVQVRYVDEVGPFNDVPLGADAAPTKVGAPPPTMIHEPETRISQAATFRLSDAAATKKIE
jgi:pSer/pThr/pTyr-binding forkhead associated (FHA) protein